ncbi:hypothetical protein D3C87_862920 [compost metagenome]
MTTPNPQSRSAAEIAEEEALRKQFAELQEQVLRDSRARVAQLDLVLKQNLERIAYYDRLISQIAPFIAEIEAGPAAPGDGPLLEKLRASRELYQASKAMAEIQNRDYRANQDTIRTAMAAAAPQAVTFSDSSPSKPYLLAKARVDAAAARLLLADLRTPILTLQRMLNPQEPLPPDTQLDPAVIMRLTPVLVNAPEIKPVLSLAISHFQDAHGLIKEANRALKGVSEYAWELSHLMGNTSPFYKLRGKMFYLERLAEQLAPYPELAELFAKAAPASAPPFKAPVPGRSGPLKPPAKSTQPLGKQTRRMMPEGNPFADRK